MFEPASRRDPLVEIEVGIRGDTAAALGQAGRKLARALAALSAAHGPERAARLRAAAQALWAYVVQREALGLTDHTRITEIYGVAPEVWRRVGCA